MSNHPNRGWRRRWIFVGEELVHTPTGLRVRFARAHDDATAWDSEAVNAEAVTRALAATDSVESVGRKMARLLREAGDLYGAKTGSPVD